jgi:hypothetical protein
MKTLPNRTIYRCDHCTKHRLTKAAAERHERFCKRNPANKHKCFGCQNLKVADGKAPDGRSCKQFTCEAFERRLYSYVAERRGLMHEGVLGPDCMRMPLECPAYALEVYEPSPEPIF